ncbi:MAG: class I SAM-dependent RNA methyltransferase, partial [Firmicutes bacterium]|nr:class I SAM-dependent RNA methyltransferase [Bacillota bacterium]
MDHVLIATAAFGIEAVVRRQVEALGCEVIKTEDGKVTFRGDEADIVRANLHLRSADRVLLRMGEFEARTFEELFSVVKGMPWEDLVPRDGRVTVSGSSVRSVLRSVPACQRIVKKAISDRLCEAYGLDRLPETGTEFDVKVTLLKD